MKVRLLIGIAVLALVLGESPAAASTIKFNPPKDYYLSLGDSLAFGYQRDLLESELVAGTYTPTDFPGFTYRFGSTMQAVDPGLTIVDFGCPGETTVSYTVGCAFQDVLPLHDGYPGISQEQAALAFLKAHHGAVGPITMSLGVNDVTPLLTACAPSFATTCVAPPIIAMGQRLGAILSKLRAAAAPNTEIIVLEYYDPYFVTPLGAMADQLALFLDSQIALAAGSAGARLANVFPIINSTGAPLGSEAANVCYFTLMCPGGDIHASDGGYAAIASVFWSASGYARLTR